MSVAGPRNIPRTRTPPHALGRSHRLPKEYYTDVEDAYEPSNSPPRSVASFAAPSVTPFDSVSQADFREWRRSRVAPSASHGEVNRSPRWHMPRRSRQVEAVGSPRLTQRNLEALNATPPPTPPLREPVSARRELWAEEGLPVQSSRPGRFEESGPTRSFKTRSAYDESGRPLSARTAGQSNADSRARSHRSSRRSRAYEYSSESGSSASTSATEQSRQKVRSAYSARSKPKSRYADAEPRDLSHIRTAPEAQAHSRAPPSTHSESRSSMHGAGSLAPSLATYIVEVERVNDDSSATPYTIHRKHKYPVYDSP